MKKQLNALVGTSLKLIAAMVFVSSCTKTRNAELPEAEQGDIYAISEIPATSESSPYSAKMETTWAADAGEESVKAVDFEASNELSADEANVPTRLKFMFDKLLLVNPAQRQFKITFSIEKDFVTAYKVVSSIKEMNTIEKGLAVSLSEVQLLANAEKTQKINSSLKTQLSKAADEKIDIKSGKRNGTLLVPLFRYAIESYGILERTKNELKESTSVLALKSTPWAQATHIKLSSKIDSRIILGLNKEEKELFKNLFSEEKINNQVMTADELQKKLKVGMKFIDDKAQVYTRLDDSVMHIYEITKFEKLNDQQKRVLKNRAGNQEVISCSDATVAAYIKSSDEACVLLLKADLPITYKAVQTEITNNNSIKKLNFIAKSVPRAQSSGLAEILENSAAKMVDISGALDPDSSIRLSDLAGEFFYRRTFESASNIFLGRTGTSGDMTIIKFELEDSRIVVRNQQSLVTYTGQGPKDREELMSFPVTYLRMNKISANGTPLAIPVMEKTTKEKAEYATIDWIKNTVPDSNSPMAFYSGGECIQAVSSQRVTDTDMRLAKDGVLNFSISGSYTVKPQAGCYAQKDVNSAYWGGSLQFNFNISERISFMRHVNKDSDKQFAQNISGMAQAAFNFGVFTLADKVTDSGALINRDGSEKYMPLIHDFRNGKKIKYYIGGLNNPEATSPERRALIIEASMQVMKEWNQTLRYAFRGTPLERAGDYVDIVVDEGNNTGHLGDLDRNYIWYQELQAENGLLGVAQPAANPRAGTIESANVIIYSGNTADQTQRLLKATELSRKYENMIEALKKNALEEAAKEEKIVTTEGQEQKTSVAKSINDGKIDRKAIDRIAIKAGRLNKNLLQSIQALQIDHKNIKDLLRNMKMKKSAAANQKRLSKELFKDQVKGQTVDYPANESTFLKKITELAVNKKLTQDPHKMELALNNAFIQFGQLDQEVQNALKVRSQMLAALIKFDDNMKNRPGCYMYSRNEVNDEALTLDPDPKKNFDLNFKKNIMSTLSHELGHAFGLLHNFKASIDKANYEFPEDLKNPTGRNYSSIMDYIADIDMKYAGPGPYDAHAIRAAYTGMIELSEVGMKDPAIVKDLNPNSNGLVAINDVVKAMGRNSLVHYTKDTLNKSGIFKYYEQCDDTGLSTSSLCKQFDSGGSATEVVQNFVSDYHRGYLNRNYVYDKILFGWPQKMELIQRNISLFQNIRTYLDEAVMGEIFGTGRPQAESAKVMADLKNAAKVGYVFFHELIRTPDASGVKLLNFNERFLAVPYKYGRAVVDNNGQVTGQEEVKDVKILEARSLYDVNMSRDKIDTVGIGYDKLFAMQFLMQSSAAKTTDDSQISNISYIDFEQFFMEVSDPSESITLNTIMQILADELKVGFFAPSNTLTDLKLMSMSMPVDINRSLGDQTAVASIIGLQESKWKGFDPFAESFKVGRSSVKMAPKDRFSVAKAGQDRKLSDTRVYFASQNAVAADILIKAAARNEVFLVNKVSIFEAMKQLYISDLEFRKPISDIIAKACVLNEAGDAAKDADACKAAQEKPMEEYLKAMPQLAPMKAKADGSAKVLVNMLRNFNAKDLIMPKELDKADSASNFVRQVEVLRSNLSTQLSLINEVLAILKDTKPEALQQTIQSIVQQLTDIRAKNDVLAAAPLLSIGQAFIAEFAAALKVKLQGSEGEISGAVIANILVSKDKLQNQYVKQLEVIEKLGLYTGLVDPDTVLQ